MITLFLFINNEAQLLLTSAVLVLMSHSSCIISAV